MQHRLKCKEVSVAGEDAAVLVLLHGFGANRHAFNAMEPELSKVFRILSFDLPGHGGSLDFPNPDKTGCSADAVWAELDEMGIQEICLCGHSLGGAVASLMALKQPDRIKALTLIAPGGFGYEINAKPLMRFARAKTAAEIAPIIEQFYGFKYQPPKEVSVFLAKSRANDKVVENLQIIAEALFGSGEQGTLPRNELFALDISIKVLWGVQDNITPTRQAHKLPGSIAAHVFDGVGHMVHEEKPLEVAKLIISHS